MVHQYNENMAPDSDFVPGSVHFLVPGNMARLLDKRRTPGQILDIKHETGQFTIEITDFEDKGARWLMPYEEVNLFQFSKNSIKHEDVQPFEEAIKRFDRPLKIPATRRPLPGLGPLRKQARSYLDEITFNLVTPDRMGSRIIWDALFHYMKDRGLHEMEEAFATQFVSNPYSGELVKGHRIVVAELGLVAYEGKAIRDPDLFTGSWSKEKRADHILSRLAFIRELFAQLGYTHVLLWRALSTPRELKPHPNKTFLSTSFRREVSESIFKVADETQVSVLYCQRVPVERVFMTYIETEAMNRQFLEAEAILFFDPGNLAF